MQFVQERLRHHHHPPLTRSLGTVSRPRVTRRFVVEMERGEARLFERVDATVSVTCARGSLWITHDGDPKDVILHAHQCYRAERTDPMHVFALEATLLEIEFEDEVLLND